MTVKGLRDASGVLAGHIDDLESTQTGGLTKDGQFTTTGTGDLKKLAEVLFVDEGWLRGDSDATGPKLARVLLQKLLAARTDAARGEPNRMNQAPVRADDWAARMEAATSPWAALNAAWRDVLHASRRSDRHEDIAKTVAQSKQGVKPWPTYHRSDLLADRTPSFDLGLDPWALRSICAVFTAEQLAALAPVLVPSISGAEWQALIDEEPDLHQNAVSHELVVQRRRLSRPVTTLPMTFVFNFMAKGKPTYSFICDQFADRLRAARKRQDDGEEDDLSWVPDAQAMLSWAFRAHFPDDQDLSLPDLVEVHRSWHALMTKVRTPGDPADQDDWQRFQGMILADKQMRQALGWGVGADAVDERLQHFMQKGAIIPVATGWYLVADEDDRQRWSTMPAQDRPRSTPTPGGKKA